MDVMSSFEFPVYHLAQNLWFPSCIRERLAWLKMSITRLEVKKFDGTNNFRLWWMR